MGAQAIQFFLNFVPPKATAQTSLRIVRNKIGACILARPKNHRGEKAKRMLGWMLAPFRPPCPLTGPLHVSVVWCHPFKQTERKRDRAAWAVPCATRPDCDNLQKALFDTMTKTGFWNDDSQIVRVSFEKWRCERPGIWVRIVPQNDVDPALKDVVRNAVATRRDVDPVSNQCDATRDTRHAKGFGNFDLTTKKSRAELVEPTQSR